MKEKVLAADLGSVTGLAGHPWPDSDRQNLPWSVAVPLPKVTQDNDGPMLRYLRRTLIDAFFMRRPVRIIENDFGLLKAYCPTSGEVLHPYYTILVVEAALPTNIKDEDGRPISTITTTKRQFYRAGVAIEVATAFGIETYEVNLSSVRSSFCSSPRRGSGKDREDTGKWVIRNCNDIGWHPQDHNEADAMAIFDHACHLIKQPFPRHAGPLYKPQVRL